MDNKIKFDELLQGLEIIPNSYQTVSGLTVVPLRLTNPDFERKNKYANPLEVLINTNQGYGSVTVQARSDGKTTILPAGSYFITKKAAQDHAISSPAKVGSRSQTYSNARCVQSTQNGSIPATRDGLEQGIMPLALREVAWDKEKSTDFGEIWGDLAQFNRSMNASSNQSLKPYFTKWGNDLSKFIAHFERPDSMIGMIVFHKGEVIAIDRFPSVEYAQWMWEPLVRDAYASVVISDHIKNNITIVDEVSDAAKSIPESQRSSMSVFERISSAVNTVTENLNTKYKERLEDLQLIEFTTESQSTDVYRLKSEGFIGHVVQDDGFNAHISVIKRDRFDSTRYREAMEARRLSRTQGKFNVGGL